MKTPPPAVAEFPRNQQLVTIGLLLALLAIPPPNGPVFPMNVQFVTVGLLLLAIMPAGWSKLFTEPAGQMMLAIALVLQVVGFLAIQRALRIEV